MRRVRIRARTGVCLVSDTDGCAYTNRDTADVPRSLMVLQFKPDNHRFRNQTDTVRVFDTVTDRAGEHGDILARAEPRLVRASVCSVDRLAERYRQMRSLREAGVVDQPCRRSFGSRLTGRQCRRNRGASGSAVACAASRIGLVKKLPQLCRLKSAVRACRLTLGVQRRDDGIVVWRRPWRIR